MKKILIKYIFMVMGLFFFQCKEVKKINAPVNSLIDTTNYYEFHSNYWINLHHFLYQKAKGSQEKKLLEDNSQLIDINEEIVYKNLTSQELEILNKAISYYENNIIEKNLYRDLREFTYMFRNQENVLLQDNELLTNEYKNVINEASVIYRKHFWEIYKEQNEKVIKAKIELIKDFENNIFNKMEKLSKDKLPNQKIRVDITAYANFAGAYTITKPDFNIYISSLDPDCYTNGIIETIFHEGSHLLFGFGSPFRESIYDISKEIDIEFPRNLWHAALFYLCGKAIEDELKKIGEDYEMVMIVRNIFSRYYTPTFINQLDAYYNGQQDLKITLTNILKKINDS